MRQAIVVRPGFSLLEVVLASAIFLIALVGLTQLLSVSSQQAIDIQRMNRAAQILQSKLNEVVAGVEPLTSTGEATLDDDPDWVWSMTAEPQSEIGLYRVTITVSFARDASSSWSVTQLVLDPAQRGGIEAPSSGNSSGTSSATTPSGGP